MTTAVSANDNAAPPAGTHELPPPVHTEVAQGLQYAARLRDQGQLPGAINLVKRLREIEPKSAAVLFFAASLDERQRRYAAAERAYGQIPAWVPGHVPSLVRRASCLANMKRNLEALDLLEEAVRLSPESVGVHNAIGRHLLTLRQHARAASHLERVAAASNDPVVWVDAAGAHDLAGDKEKAIAAFQKALAVSPVKAPLHVRLSTLELVRGNRDAARRHLEDALAADRTDGHAHLSLAIHFPADANEAAIRAALDASGGKPLSLYAAPLWFALARVLERDGRNAEAFEAYTQANALMAPLQRPSDAANAAIAARLKLYSPAFIASHQSWGHRSEAPVFVFGLPRSGTSLVEQIIASHPDAVGFGETAALPPLVAGLSDPPTRDEVRRAAAAYLAALPPEANSVKRFVDKSLSTWMVLGPAMLLFPKARFIHCDRHPMDTAWSTYTELFTDNALPDAYVFERLAAQARLARDTTAAWSAAFPGKVLTVRYERLVADPEPEVRRILAHLGLDWNDACLKPHETQRTVRTASMSRVRQPIHASSVQRWRRYETQLAPLSALMADLIADYERTA